MVEGWREDFNAPKLPVGIIGFCAGSIAQKPDNFEIWSNSPAAYIREAQRLGLTDLEDPSNTAFLPACDIQVPGLHPGKKQAHAIRAARWALGRIYGMRVNWGTASLVSAEPDGDRMVLTFNAPVFPDKSCELEYRVRYTISADLLADLSASLAGGTTPRRIRYWAKFDLLIIDEFGFDRIER